MPQGAVTVTKAWRTLYGLLHVCMGAGDGFHQGKTLRQPAGDGRSKRAACAMGMGRVAALGMEQMRRGRTTQNQHIR